MTAFLGRPMSFKSRLNGGLYLGALITVMASPPTLALAQDAGAGADDPVTIDEIVVTASRAAPTGFTAPTPTTVVGAEALEQMGAGNVSQALVQIPAFKATQGAAANATRSANPGAAPADLRALGAQRTLVLINGLRSVPQAPVQMTGATVSVDLNMVPALLTERVEVVTGGASAQWGSDAVAGVVNIILRNRFEGMQLRAQAGISQQGDGEDIRFGALFGTRFANGRGHVVAALDYQSNEVLGDLYTRDWGAMEYLTLTNPSPATNGRPTLITSPNVRTTLAPGGRITGPNAFSLNGYTFTSTGGVRPFQVGQLAGTAHMIGGEGFSTSKGVSLAPGVERYNPYVRAQYDLTDRLQVFGELSYSRSKSEFTTVAQRNTGVTIRRENAFLPTVVRNAMVAEGLTSFQMNRISFDFGPRDVQVDNESLQGTLGVRGEFGDGWSWDVQYRKGRNAFSSDVLNNTATPLLNFAVDAIEVGGQIVCRATQPGASFNAAASGCVPINLFGEGAPSEAALNYVNRTAHTTSDYDMETVVANISGSPFSSWAGPVTIATGLEYRRESQEVNADGFAAVNAFSTGNGSPFSGDFDVMEGYFETVVPLARDLSWARNLDFNAAIRYADYSTFDGQTTWKVGATWEPNDWLLLRATRSRDIRAPALYELYSSGAVLTAAVTVKGVSATIPGNVSIGNPNLEPEKADTTTIGAVFTPTGPLQGLRFSIDYYDIDLRDAITNLSAANIASLCTLGEQRFCDMFTFSTTGVPTSLSGGAQNLSSFRSTGYDFVAAYQTSADALFPNLPGRLSTNFSATYVETSSVDLGTGAGAVERAGETGQANLGALPRFRFNLSQSWSTETFTLTAQVLHLSESNIDNTYNTLPALSTNLNNVPAVTYVNLYGAYRFGESNQYELFAAVDNAFDKDPPPVPYTVINAPTNGAFYDKMGRFYRVGLSYRF